MEQIAEQRLKESYGPRFATICLSKGEMERVTRIPISSSKDFDEFIVEIIKTNNIVLPVHPRYRKYGYDVSEHKLIILEYPDLK